MDTTLSPTSTTAHQPLTATLALFAASLVLNLAILGIGELLGGSFIVDNRGTTMDIGPLEVALASILPLAVAVAGHRLLAPRLDLVRRLWTPVVAVLTVLSLGAVTSAEDLTTAVALGTMHLVVGGLAAVGIPARQGR